MFIGFLCYSFNGYSICNGIFSLISDIDNCFLSFFILINLARGLSIVFIIFKQQDCDFTDFFFPIILFSVLLIFVLYFILLSFALGLVFCSFFTFESQKLRLWIWEYSDIYFSLSTGLALAHKFWEVEFLLSFHQNMF